MVVGHNQNCCWAPPLSLTQGLKSTSNFKRGTIISYIVQDLYINFCEVFHKKTFKGTLKYFFISLFET